MPLLHAVGVVLALAAAAAAQTTWVVSGGGAALLNAINNAVAGDTLDVQPGVYHPVLCGKGVRLVLQPGAQVGDAWVWGPALTFLGVPANEVAIVQAGIVHGLSCQNCAGTVIVAGTNVRQSALHIVTPSNVTSCTGPVVFQNVSFEYTAPTLGDGELHLMGSSQVAMCGGLLPRVWVLNSRVSCSNATIRPSGYIGTGFSLSSGSATLDGGTVTGPMDPTMINPHLAMRVDGGELTATGGATIACLPHWPTVPQTSLEAYGGIVRLDPSVTVIRSPPIVGPGTVLVAPIPSLDVAHTTATLTVTAFGQPGNVLVTFAGLATPPYATPWGEAWVLPTDPILDVTLLPAAAATTFSRTFASVPPFVALTLQSVAIAPAGTLRIGVPTRFAWN